MMAGFLFLMMVFILGNVVLRYCFNSGITWAEEISRFLFVWIVFIGAIGAMQDNRHLGFTSVVKKMPLPVKKIFVVVSNILILYVLYLLLTGTWAMTILGLNNRASSTDVPLAWMFGVGLISFSWIAIIVCVNTYKALFVEGAVNKLIDLHESEDDALIEKLTEGDEK
jgi:TRAP-type C4-dicarboxylate transport system permease small subunit